MTKSTFSPSIYQQKLFDFVATGRGSAIVTAVAGAGKTTSTVRCLAFIPAHQEVYLLAFNTDAAEALRVKIVELEKELGRSFSNARAATFHSLCFGAVRKALEKRGITNVKPDGKKLRILAERMFDNRTDDGSPSLYETYGDFIVKLVGLARGEGVGVLTPDLPTAWWNLIQHHDLFLDTEGATEERAIELAQALLRRSNEEARAGNIDFDDMLYQVLAWRLRIWQRDFVFVDEAQDTNPVRRAIVKLVTKPGGRMIAVGDRFQAIYGFTGASHDAIDQLKSAFNAVELYLTVSYRCAKAVVESAREVVSHIEPFEGAIDGRVEVNFPFREMVKILGAHDAILCRQTAPLVSLAYDLIARGIGCRVLGKDIGSGLVKLIKATRARGVPNLIEKLDAYREREVARFTAKGEESKAEAIEDRVACVMTVLNHLPETERTIPAAIAKIEGMFKDENGVLTLSTIHKAKGKEWENVAIYRRDLMPSKWARQEHQVQEERNLDYVARTRAKATLMFIAKDEAAAIKAFDEKKAA